MWLKYRYYNNDKITPSFCLIGYTSLSPLNRRVSVILGQMHD